MGMINFQLQSLPPSIRKGYRLKNILHNLVAVTELCDARCRATFKKHDVEISDCVGVIIQEWKDEPTRLWHNPW
eukprot:6664080-Ditylum_brightwellii.AAC.1